MNTYINLTIAEMLTHTYLEVPILDKYKIAPVGNLFSFHGCHAIIEQGDRLYISPIIPEKKHDNYQVSVMGVLQPVTIPALSCYTVFVDGMYHKYPESVDYPIHVDGQLSNYVPRMRITEYLLEPFKELK